MKALQSSLFSATLFAAAAATFVTVASSLVYAQSAPQDAAAQAASSAPVPCSAPADLIRLAHPLARTARRLAAGEPITIVAIGSSSTAGAGASTPDRSYPSRLAVELKALFPRAEISVINRGINGETAVDMLARFDTQVLADKPDVVVWQVGSNSVLRDQPIGPVNTLVHQGVAKLKAAGIDVVLMNPQYAPKFNSKPDAEKMIDLMDLLAKEMNVDMFQRYAVMRYWRLTENIPFSTFTSADELHMNDWSYGCVAKLLASAIGEASTRASQTAIAKSPAR
jgi:lysophospholipase L1-like esterase